MGGLSVKKVTRIKKKSPNKSVFEGLTPPVEMTHVASLASLKSSTSAKKTKDLRTRIK